MGKELEKTSHWLNQEQIDALERFNSLFGSGGSPTRPIAQFEQDKLQGLYISGSTIGEIAEINPQFTLGQIVYAATTNSWELKKQQHAETAVTRAQERAVSVVAESVDFIADSISVMHKKYSKRLKKYLQTGNETDLEDWKVGDLRAYERCIALLAQVTGQVKTVRHIVEGKPPEEKKQAPQVEKTEEEILADFALEKKGSAGGSK